MLPLLLLGVLVPLCLLPAHGIPGHPRTTGASAHVHEAVQAGANDLSGEQLLARPGERSDPGAPFCDSALDFSSSVPARSFADRSPDLGLLLVAAAAVTAVLHSRTVRPALLRSRPPWRPFGVAFLTLAGISRT